MKKVGGLFKVGALVAALAGGAYLAGKHLVEKYNVDPEDDEEKVLEQPKQMLTEESSAEVVDPDAELIEEYFGDIDQKESEEQLEERQERRGILDRLMKDKFQDEDSKVINVNELTGSIRAEFLRSNPELEELREYDYIGLFLETEELINKAGVIAVKFYNNHNILDVYFSYLGQDRIEDVQIPCDYVLEEGDNDLEIKVHDKVYSLLVTLKED